MEHCIWCDNKSLNVSANQYGLCDICSFLTPDDIKARFAFIRENKKVIEKSKDTDTIVSLTIISLFHLKHLLKQEEENNELLTQPIHNFIIRMVQTSNERMLSLLTDECRMIKIKSKNLLPEKSMEAAQNKFITMAVNLRNYILDDDLPLVDKMITEVRSIGRPGIRVNHNLILTWFLSKIHALRFYGYRQLEGNAWKSTIH